MLNAKKLPSVNNSNTKRPDPLPAGTYPARLVQVVLMGIQKERPYMGEERAPRLYIRLTYEFLDEFMKDEEGNDQEDRPRWLSEDLPFLTLKADLAKSTKRYYALDPESKADGDWAQLIGAPCMVTVINEADKRPGIDRIYERIASVSTMRAKEASKAVGLKNPGLIFDFYIPDMQAWAKLPEWLQDRIKGAVDFEGGPLEALLGGAGRVDKEKTKDVVGIKAASVQASDEDEEAW